MAATCASISGTSHLEAMAELCVYASMGASAAPGWDGATRGANP